MKGLLLIALMAIITLVLAVGYDLVHTTEYDLSHREDIGIYKNDTPHAVDYGCGTTWNYVNKRGL